MKTPTLVAIGSGTLAQDNSGAWFQSSATRLPFAPGSVTIGDAERFMGALADTLVFRPGEYLVRVALTVAAGGGTPRPRVELLITDAVDGGTTAVLSRVANPAPLELPAPTLDTRRTGVTLVDEIPLVVSGPGAVAVCVRARNEALGSNPLDYALRVTALRVSSL